MFGIFSILWEELFEVWDALLGGLGGAMLRCGL
jgi:hypothetical protein